MTLPDKSLSPNSRSHWAVKSRHKAAHRNEAAVLTRQALVDVGLGVDWSTVLVKPYFFYPTKRKRDRDNCSAMLKAARDGIADALREWGIIEDDDCFIPMPSSISVDRERPRVEIVISNQ
ncbi:MAG: hypothetical protein Unbinned1606contig1000_3 [Prokaryotic dsDNA virus sp.]|nr:MAG: hypothetical protein Unbinned1606contig1000_3 [Prokaryotic dsDNA virus sp.]